MPAIEEVIESGESSSYTIFDDNGPTSEYKEANIRPQIKSYEAGIYRGEVQCLHKVNAIGNVAAS